MKRVRFDGRKVNQIRPMRIIPGFQRFAEGSALIELGETKVICAATVEERVPGFLRRSGSGWITAEYSMLPRSTQDRMTRESSDKPRGRTQEIQRLVGRSLRAGTDLYALGEITFVIDCDVIQADGGTRTAAITGAYVALCQAFKTLIDRGHLSKWPMKSTIGATSVGIVEGVHLLDLCYEEDSRAEVDFNVVMNDAGEFIEIQGTAEGKTFSKSQLDALLELAETGIGDIFQIQKAALDSIGIPHA